MATCDEIKARIARVFRKHSEVCFVAVTPLSNDPNDTQESDFYVWAGTDADSPGPRPTGLRSGLRRLLAPLRRTLAPFGVRSVSVFRDGMDIEPYDVILYRRA